MALPWSGLIQASDINVELGRAWNHWFDMNGSAERNLAGKPSGTISFWDFYGKSNIIREPPTGEHYQLNYNSFTIYGWAGDADLWWMGTRLIRHPIVMPYVIGNWTYYRGSFKGSSGGGYDEHFAVYRIGKY